MGPLDLKPGEAKGAPNHPHRGFETITYMLEGRFEHKDSHGNVHTIVSKSDYAFSYLLASSSRQH